jgi:hypothetical protein
MFAGAGPITELVGLHPSEALHHGIGFAGFNTTTDLGVWQSFLTMGVIYFTFMIMDAC